MFIYRHLSQIIFLCIFIQIAGFSSAVLAQSTPDVQDKSILIPAGTPVILETFFGFTAKETKEGDIVMLRVRIPVRIKDYIVINYGAAARGVVTLSRSASSWGGAGELQLEARSVQRSDGTEALVNGVVGRKGDTLHGASAAVTVGGALLCLPLGLAGAAVKGEEGEMRAGYEIVTRILSDTLVHILTEDERIKMQQDQVKNNELLAQRIQEDKEKKAEGKKRKDTDSQIPSDR